MGSLYEPSVRSSTWYVVDKRLSQRFTTLEGWREIGLGIYTMGSSNIRMFSPRNQFDSESFRDDADDVVYTTAPDAPPVPSKKRMSLIEYERSAAPPAYPSNEKTSAGADQRLSKVSFYEVVTPKPDKKPIPEPYHVFLDKEKWIIVGIVSTTGMLPALTFYSFLPGIPVIATDLQVSIQAVNLSITFFLIIQGVAPIFWQPLIDTIGRRSVYIYSLLIYIITTINLSLSVNYPMMLVFRGFQGAGVASLVSIGCAVIQDMVPSASRTQYICIYQHVRNATLVFSPIIGGLMTANVDFRCVAILLFALALTYLVTILFFLPETLRAIAGNGTVPLKGIHLPLLYRLQLFGTPPHESPLLSPRSNPPLSPRKFLRPLLLLREKDIVPNLLFASIVYAIWVMVTVNTVPLFSTAFHSTLSPASLGFLFLPNLLGTIAGTSLIGNLLARDFTAATTSYKQTNHLPATITISKLSLPSDFPLEKTRLARLPALTILFILATSFYGFTLMYPSLTALSGWPTVPLLLQFLIATTAHAICGVHHTLVADLWPLDAPAAAVAANLVKGVFAGAGVAGVQWLVRVAEAGPVFLGLAFVVCAGVPLVVGEWVWGAAWRREREERLVRGGVVDRGVA